MPIQIHESTSTRKLIDVTVTPSATGAHLVGAIEWYAGGRAERYEIDVDVPCVYSDDARYRVALCTTPPRLVLVEDDATPSDEVCYLARWRFTAPTDTCETVTIEVPRRVLIPEPSTFAGDGLNAPIEIPPAPLPTPTVHQVTTVELPAETPARAASRRQRRRIRELRQQARAMKEAGTTYSAMTAAQRQAIQELTALLADVPLALP